MHEVSMCRCVRITRVVRRVGSKESMLRMYEGLPNLASFLEEFEEKVTEPHRLFALDYVLKATSARWWGTHKQSISEWTQCRRLMEIIFREDISYDDQKYTGLSDPGKHIEHYRTTWKAYMRKEWVHRFIQTLEMVPRGWYTSEELQRGTFEKESLMINFTQKFEFTNEHPILDVAL